MMRMRITRRVKPGGMKRAAPLHNEGNITMSLTEYLCDTEVKKIMGKHGAALTIKRQLLSTQSDYMCRVRVGPASLAEYWQDHVFIAELLVEYLDRHIIDPYVKELDNKRDEYVAKEQSEKSQQAELE